jgi:acid phosphatase
VTTIRFIAVVAAVAVGNACSSPAPTPTPAPIGGITATLSPIPVPTTAESITGSALFRYRAIAQVTFHADTGVSAHITQMVVALLNEQGAGNPQTTVLDLVLPSGGSVSRSITHVADLPSGQAVRIQVSASGGDSSGKPISVSPVLAPLAIAAPPTNGPFNHVFVVVEENRRFEDVIGNPEMPFLNSLAAQYALATEYYAVTHPSIGNYLMLTTGNVVTNSDSFSGIVTDDNIVRQLIAAGRTWKSYAEDLPSVGYTGGDVGGYARRHNVFALLSDVVGSPAQSANLVPFSQFAIDLAANTVPNYAYIVPNLCNDGHDCPSSVVDGWLRANVGPLIATSQFQRDGLLIITYDEGPDADRAHGGGRVAWIAVSNRTKRGYRSSIFYQHQSTLRLTAQALGLVMFPNQAATAPDMSEFFF